MCAYGLHWAPQISYEAAAEPADELSQLPEDSPVAALLTALSRSPDIDATSSYRMRSRYHDRGRQMFKFTDSLRPPGRCGPRRIAAKDRLHLNSLICQKSNQIKLKSPSRSSNSVSSCGSAILFLLSLVSSCSMKPALDFYAPRAVQSCSRASSFRNLELSSFRADGRGESEIT